jgi:hypothetical protein
VLGDFDDGRCNLLALSKIQRPLLGSPPRLGDLLDNRGHAFTVAIKDGDFCAFIGKEMGCARPMLLAAPVTSATLPAMERLSFVSRVTVSWSLQSNFSILLDCPTYS